MPSVNIKTYGCQMKERAGEAVAAQLVAKGYTLAASEHVADVVLLNTCSAWEFSNRIVAKQIAGGLAYKW